MADLNIAVKIVANDAASTPLQQVTRSVKGLKQEAQGTDDTLKKANKSLEAMTGIVAGLGGAIGIFKKAFNLAAEGAQIKKTEERFDALNDSVSALSDDTLQRLQGAVDGSVEKLALMENANLLLSTGAAASQSELVGVVENIIKLKKPTDDASGAIENFALLLANKSIPRLDSYGLSASRVKARYEELRDTVDDDTAFRTAVFEEMQVALKNVGQESDFSADAFTRLKVRAADATDEFKVFLAEGLEPWVKFILGDYRKAIETVVEGAEDIGTVYDKSIRGLAVLTSADDVAAKKLLDVAAGVARSSSSYDEFITKLDAAGISIDQVNSALVNNIETLHTNSEEFYTAQARAVRYADQLSNVAAVVGRVSQSEQDLADVNDWYQYVLENTVDTQDDYNLSAQEMNEIQERMTKSADSLAVAKGIERERHEENMAAIAASNAAYAEQVALMQENEAAQRGYFDAALRSDNAIFKWTQSVVVAGGRTDDQTASLEELRGEYGRLQDDLRSYESGVKGIGLSEDERNEKIAKTTERMGALAAAVAPLEGIQSEVVSSTSGWTVSQENANQALYDSVAAAGASSSELALLGVSLGVISEEAANAALKTSLFQQGLDKMAEAALEDGVLTRDEIFGIQEDASQLLDTINNLPPLVDLEFETNAYDAAAAADALANAVMNVPTSRDITFNVNTVGNIPVPPEFGDAAGEKGGNVYGAAGVDFMVPAGYENDTFGPIFARSGERVRIETPGQQQQNGGVAGRQVNNFYIYPSGMSASPDAIASTVANKLAKKG